MSETELSLEGLEVRVAVGNKVVDVQGIPYDVRLTPVEAEALGIQLLIAASQTHHAVKKENN